MELKEMVGQVIAGSVAPVVISSATEDGGFLNRILKFLTIIAIVAGFIILAIGLLIAFNIYEAVGGVIGDVSGGFFGFLDFITTPIIGAPNFSLLGGIVGSGITGFISSIVGRR